MNPLNPPGMKQNPVLVAVGGGGGLEGESPKYIVKSFWPFPLCFISGDSSHTTVTADETLMRQNSTVCELGVKQGAGYDLTSLPHTHTQAFGLSSLKFCCFAEKGRGWVMTRPTSYTHSAPINGETDLAGFLSRLWMYVPAHQGLAAEPLEAQPLALVQKNLLCGCKSRVLKAHKNGLLLLEDKEKGMINTSRIVQAATLKDFSSVTYNRAPLLAALCCGKENEVKVHMHGLTLHSPGTNAEELDRFHAGVLTATLGKTPSPPIHTIQGKNGAKVVIGPEFTTVEVASCAWLPPCAAMETTTIKTGDINYLGVKLPGWINALIQTIRDFEFWQMSENCTRCWAEDFPQAAVGWVVPFAYRSYIVTGLMIKFLISLLTFLVIFLCRASSITLGGPRPHVIALPHAEENPEALLKEISNAIVQGQRQHAWGGGGHDFKAAAATTSVVAQAASGAGKQVATRLPPGWEKCGPDTRGEFWFVCFLLPPFCLFF